MKKLLFALALGLILVLALATVAMADNGPHGGFSATTDACAGCHRAHSAAFGSNALLIADPEALCLSCHDGSGAGTNVQDGVYTQAGSNAYTGGGANAKVEGTDGASLFGGGFVNALMATTWSGAVTANPAFDATSKSTTSTHGLNAGATWQLGVSGTIWGSGANNSVNGTLILECTSCHNPHGTAGYTNLTTQTTVCNTALLLANPVTEACTVKVPSYRLLRWQPSDSGGFTAPATSVNWSGGAFPASGATTGWTVPDNYLVNGTEWYTIGTTAAFAVGDYNAGNANNVYNIKNATATGFGGVVSYIPAAVNESMFCAQCHDRYFNNSRLRNATDDSVYCGAPVAGVIVNGVTLPVYAPVGGLHPLHPTECNLVISTVTGLPTNWDDNSPSGDTTYMFRHASGDIRLSMDGTVAAGAGTSVSRACAACHVSHGTTASMTALAGAADSAAGVRDGASLAGGSTLLRMDNRSICLR